MSTIEKLQVADPTIKAKRNTSHRQSQFIVQAHVAHKD
jgi:hypothetical protein